MDWTATAVSRSNTRTSRFLELPPELRDLIFEFALTSGRTLVTFRLDDYQRDSYLQATQPSLARVNRQLRHESLPIYYACNDFVLHTEGSKADDARRWLLCNEPHLPKLRRVSYWVRCITLANQLMSSQGAMSISMMWDAMNDCWKVDEQWRWITVVRRPAALENDAKLLVGHLRTLLEEPTLQLDGYGFYGLLTDLRTCYVKEKTT